MWLWPNLLSLDAPAIAFLWLRFFAETMHLYIEPTAGVALALTVWLIYVGDRLLDGWDIDAGEAIPARHEFYRIHRKPLAAAVPMGLALDIWVCLRLDLATCYAGLALSLAVVAYFGAVHLLRLRIPKQAVVALLFSTGTLLPVWIGSNDSTSAMILMLLFMAVCWLNVVLIEYSEWIWFGRSRPKMPHVSTVAAGPHLPWLAALVGVTVGAFLFLPALRPNSPALVAIALSAVALAALGAFRRHLSGESVRVLADAALLTPLFVLPFLLR